MRRVCWNSDLERRCESVAMVEKNGESRCESSLSIACQNQESGIRKQSRCTVKMPQDTFNGVDEADGKLRRQLVDSLTTSISERRTRGEACPNERWRSGSRITKRHDDNRETSLRFDREWLRLHVVTEQEKRQGERELIADLWLNGRI